MWGQCKGLKNPQILITTEMIVWGFILNYHEAFYNQQLCEAGSIIYHCQQFFLIVVKYT